MDAPRYCLRRSSTSFSPSRSLQAVDPPVVSPIGSHSGIVRGLTVTWRGPPDPRPPEHGINVYLPSPPAVSSLRCPSPHNQGHSSC
ncbi:hypothetical protein GDO81_026867 [Engystomops pustulosus]|uniref:Uncharacterized protein n=1 Tax=Engystomops pustulosus TaxID=76066 RepID=A0AAV6Z2G2_ENGPU|nr:hypothetical protein GDO81_026867 [Engystomops pustulosus]